MAGRLGGRVVHFANLPIKLLMPSNFTNITEIALKTIPSASKIEIKRVLESLYGFEVDKVRTLNMDGKKLKRGGLLFAKPDYKKAYVTLKNPLSLSKERFPIQVIEDERNRINKKEKPSFVEDGEGKKHWLDRKDGETAGKEKDSARERGRRRRGIGDSAAAVTATAKFPWSSMRGSR